MADTAVITGIGVVSPAGIGLNDFWNGMKSGKSFIRPITRFETEQFESKVAGMVEPFQATDYLDPRIVAQTDRWTHFDLISARQAVEDACLDIRAEDPARVAAIFSAGSGGNEFGQHQLHTCWSQGPNFVSAYLSIAWFYAASIGQVSINQGIRGYGRNICAEAAGGLIALSQASKAIMRGVCDIAIVGGSEACISPYAFACHQASSLISSDTSAHPYRPFDAQRSGTIIGEGGAVFCVESKEHALRRNARIYAEISGWGQSFDGAYTREPTRDGKEYARAISTALNVAHLSPEDIDWIVCDGLGTPCGDIAEVYALTQAFGDSLPSIPASAPKSMIGRLFNGASTVDVAAAVMGMTHDTILPTVGYEIPDPLCTIDCVPNSARSQPVQHVLVGARGTGGFNAALVLRKLQ